MVVVIQLLILVVLTIQCFFPTANCIDFRSFPVTIIVCKAFATSAFPSIQAPQSFGFIQHSLAPIQSFYYSSETLSLSFLASYFAIYAGRVFVWFVVGICAKPVKKERVHYSGGLFVTVTQGDRYCGT